MEIKRINNQQAQNAIDQGCIPEELTGISPFTVIILTQTWCSDWANLKQSLKELETLDAAIREKLSLLLYEYDKTPIFKEFAHFKETKLQNSFIPFVLVYKQGRLVAQGNFHHADKISQALLNS